MKLTFIVPHFNDTQSLYKLISEIKKKFSKVNFSILIIDDYSNQDQLILEKLKNIKVDFTILRLNSNLGHQFAISVGLHYLFKLIDSDQKVIMMDCDGEDSPSDALKIFKYSLLSDADFIVAQRFKRSESFIFKFFYFFYKAFFRFLTGHIIDFGNFMLTHKAGLKKILFSRNVFIHVAASVLYSKASIQKIPTSRGVRFFGKSKMNIYSLFLHAINAISVFSTIVLVRIIVFSIMILSIFIILFLIALILKLTDNASQGWFSIFIFITIFAFIFLILNCLILIMSKDKSDNFHFIKDFDIHQYIESIENFKRHD